MWRKTLCRWSVCLAAMGLLVSACSSDEGGSSGNGDGDGEGEPAPGRTTLQVAIPSEPTTTNPFTNADSSGGLPGLGVTMMPLFWADNENELTSNILESWEMSDDARTATLQLRPDVQWSDGTPITSADVVMSLTIALDPELNFRAGIISGVVGQQLFLDGDAESISGLTAPDDHTVVVELEEPNAAWLSNLGAVVWITVWPEHILGEVPRDELGEHEYFETYPVTSGPYKFVDWERGQHFEFERNENWSLGQPGFEKIFFKIISDTEAVGAQLESGEIQFAPQVDPADADRINAIEGLEVASAPGVAPDVWGIQHYEPLLDSRVRQAMAYAIDREGICEAALQGYCTVPTTNLRLIGQEWAVPGDLTEYDYDPERARKLLDEAGWDSSTELTFLHRPGQSDVDTAIEIAQGNLADVGMSWTIQNVSEAELLERAEDGDSFNGWWVTGANFTADPNAMAPYASCDTHFPDGPNIIHYCNEELDQLWDAGLRTADPDERAEIYHEAFRILNEEVPEIYLYVADEIVAHDSRLKGVKAHGNIAGQYWNIGEWHWQE